MEHDCGRNAGRNIDANFPTAVVFQDVPNFDDVLVSDAHQVLVVEQFYGLNSGLQGFNVMYWHDGEVLRVQSEFGQALHPDSIRLDHMEKLLILEIGHFIFVERLD